MEKKNFTVEEATKKAKGLWGHIKHLVKDPIKTVPESKERWKEVLRFLIISIALVAIPTVINTIVAKIIENPANIISKILNTVTFVGMIGFIFSLFLVIVLVKISGVLKLRECTNCKEQITYDDKVNYEVLRKWMKTEKRTKNGTTTVIQQDLAQVRISCACQKCGTQKVFTREFCSARYYNGSLVMSHEIDYLVKGLFTGEYIQ